MPVLSVSAATPAEGSLGFQTRVAEPVLSGFGAADVYDRYEAPMSVPAALPCTASAESHGERLATAGSKQPRKRMRRSTNPVPAERPQNGSIKAAQHNQRVQAVPVDWEEQELLRELANVTGSSTTSDALQRALNRLKGGCSVHAPASAAPQPARVQTPPIQRASDPEPGSAESCDLLHMEFDADEEFLSSLSEIPCAERTVQSMVESAEELPRYRPEPDFEHAHEPESQAVGLDYGRLMDSHGFGLVLMDMSGRFLHWNKTIEQVLGYDTSQMKQLSMMHVTPVEDLPAMMQLMPRLLGGPGNQPPTLASPLHLMKRCVTRSGEDLAFHVRMSVVQAANALPYLPGDVSTGRIISCLVDCHGPHTWELPTSSGVCAFGMLATHQPPASTPQAAVVCSQGAAAGTHSGSRGPGLNSRRRTCTGETAANSGSNKSRTRVPLPRQAVAELRDLLRQSRYPELAAREAIAQRYGLDRKRVDRWLENTRARQVAQEKATRLL